MPASPLKYHGGKSDLADWIAFHSPHSNTKILGGKGDGQCWKPLYTHRNIVCAGGLGELLGTRAWPIYGVSETVNDTNHDVTNFWRVLGSPAMFGDLQRWLEVTEFGRQVFEDACKRTQMQASMGVKGQLPVSRARDFYIIMRQGQQGKQQSVAFATPTKRLRRGMNEHVSAWLTSIDGLAEVHDRLKRVAVESLDAIEFIKLYDHEDAFFYIDPTYLDETRVSSNDYACESQRPTWHNGLLNCLSGIQGKFLLSGYYSYLYWTAAVAYGWNYTRKLVTKSSSRAAVKPSAYEYLWANYAHTHLEPCLAGHNPETHNGSWPV